MSVFVTKTIEELTGMLIDYRGKTPPKSDNGIRLITAKVIKEGRILDEKHEYISEETYKTWMHRGFPEKGDVLITTEAPLGEVAQLKTSDKIALAQRVILLRGKPELINQRFYYYSLQSPYAQAELKARATGTTVFGIKQSELRKVRIPYFRLDIQNKIFSILSAYDDLIENNLKRIKILEEMAQMIYREWFVNFRFPGHEKVKMVKSELGMIPEGWEVKKLGDFVELAYGKALKADDRRDGKVPVFGSGGICGYHNKALVKGPGIIVGRKGNVGSVFWSDDDFYPIDTVFYVKTELELHYVYYNLLNQNFFNTDAAVPGLNRNQAYSNKFLHPDEVLMKTFAEFINAIFEQKKTLKVKNDNLRKTRDLLLPKLISGEIDVARLDIQMGEGNG